MRRTVALNGVQVKRLFRRSCAMPVIGDEVVTPNTKPEVFIIESLDFEDEREERYEGKILSSILALSGKKCAYYYIRTKRELEAVLGHFTESTYRYLHLSCHGNANGQTMHTTLEAIPFGKLGPIIRPHLRGKRLFVSACSMVNDDLAQIVMPDSRCCSILGPAEKIGFNDAAILWASLYHVLLSSGAERITNSGIKQKAQEVANMYQVQMTYVCRDPKLKAPYLLSDITPAKNVLSGRRVKGSLQLA